MQVNHKILDTTHKLLAANHFSVPIFVIWGYLSIELTDNVAIRERIDVPTEDKVEMEIYDRDKKYFGECQKRFTEWYNKHSQPRTKSKV